MVDIQDTLTRRSFLVSAGAAGFAATSVLATPFYSRGYGRPSFTHGVQSGDVDTKSGMIWTRADRPSRIAVEYSTTESFSSPVRLPSIDALPKSDYTVKCALDHLLPDQDIFYRFTATDLYDSNSVSEPCYRPVPHRAAAPSLGAFRLVGRYRRPGLGHRRYRHEDLFDHAAARAGFLIHSGDTIYADNPIPDEIPLRDGTIWKNRIVTPEKREVARTLEEYRGQWKYNLLDDHVRAPERHMPDLLPMDDHEVLNNWSPSTDLRDDPRYPDKDVSVYAARAMQAFRR